MSRPASDDAARSEAIQDSELGNAIIGADVGGTYARLGWTRLDANGALSVRGFRKYTCAEHPSLAAILRDYADWLVRETEAPPIAHAVVAIAGVLDGDGDTLLNTNLAWPVSLAATRCESGMHTLELINDFVAVAQAMAHAEADSLHLICGDPSQVVPGPAVVLGPGTGLGVAVYLPGGNPSVLASEAGHAALAGSTPLEQDVLRLLSRRYTHIDNERILSGPGLLTLYTSLCELRGSTPQWHSPADLVAAAGTDPLAAESIEVFCAWLGSLAGDLALTFGARAVYLTGGITGHLSGPLHAGGFQQRFLAKDRLSQALRHVPVWRVEHGELGVLGALAWHVDKLAAR